MFHTLGQDNILREILAIKLFEHDRPALSSQDAPRCWGVLGEEDRDLYRDMVRRIARGDDPYDRC